MSARVDRKSSTATSECDGFDSLVLEFPGRLQNPHLAAKAAYLARPLFMPQVSVRFDF